MKLKIVLIALLLTPLLSGCQSTGKAPAPGSPNTEERGGY